MLVNYKQERDRAQKLAKKLKKANEKLRAVSIRDGLTGLYNHVYFQRQLDAELSRAIRYRRPLSLLMIDLDHFKMVNDNYGHRIGDMVLQKISALILNNIRTTDILSRYGGDELTLTLPETDLKPAAILADRLRNLVDREELQIDNLKVKVTISLGVATYLPNKKMPRKSELLDAADSALYKSKNGGRNKLNIVKLVP